MVESLSQWRLLDNLLQFSFDVFVVKAVEMLGTSDTPPGSLRAAPRSLRSLASFARESQFSTRARQRFAESALL